MLLSVIGSVLEGALGRDLLPMLFVFRIGRRQSAIKTSLLQTMNG